MLAGFAALSWIGVRGKSATVDEPLHLVGAWAQRHLGDHRINPEDPPLWRMWAGLSLGRDALDLVPSDPHFAAILEDESQRWPLVSSLVLATPGYGEPLVARSRAMMLVLGVVLGAAVACWAWQAGGPAAAIIATGLLALDPNMLGHAPLIKNDVALALVYLAAAWAAWRMGQRVTVARALVLGLACGAAVTTKFSGLLAGPVVAALLLVRATRPEGWLVLGRIVSTRGRRVAVAAAVCVIALLVSVAVTWLAYGLRFDATPQGGLDEPAIAMIDGPATGALESLERWRLLPQAWLYGLRFTQANASQRHAFLFGEYSLTGWWSYFPIAMLVKTPLALLAVVAAGLAAAMVGLLARRGSTRGRMDAGAAWLAVCLVLPPAAYLAAAMTSNLNIGLRHVLTVYPFVYIGIGLAGAWLWRRSRGTAAVLSAAVALGMAAETLTAAPNFIAFFNVLAGGPRGGIAVLGDSNLDWGQDLGALRRWQQANSPRRLYVLSFGPFDPADVGIQCERAWISSRPGQPAGPPRAGAGHVLAISATHLQGTYLTPDLRMEMLRLRHTLEPIDVLGGTIYLYDLDQPAARRLYASDGAAP